jgi:hypothetical protein
VRGRRGDVPVGFTMASEGTISTPNDDRRVAPAPSHEEDAIDCPESYESRNSP